MDHALPLNASETEDNIRRWLVESGLAGLELDPLLGGFCERLRNAGIAVDRGFIGLSTVHPQLRAFGAIWRSHDTMVQRGNYLHSDDPEEFAASPFQYMIDSGTYYMRRRLRGANTELDYQVLREFSEQGYTDWVAQVFGFDTMYVDGVRRPTGMTSSWSTLRPDGFADGDIATLRRLLPYLALAIKSLRSSGMTTNLLTTYLGSDAAGRVLAGEILRGSVQRLPAVILLADLRGFTAFADRADPDLIVPVLDDYLDCLGAPIARRGGHILKFLGDGLIATFALSEGEEAVIAEAALTAARESIAAVSALNERRAAAGQPTLSLDVALHCGDVLYGNVGTVDRLDFTMVGPAVNETSRIELLCKALDRPILVSRRFYDLAAVSRDKLISVGFHPLRGVRAPQEIFACAA